MVIYSTKITMVCTKSTEIVSSLRANFDENEARLAELVEDLKDLNKDLEKILEFPQWKEILSIEIQSFETDHLIRRRQKDNTTRITLISPETLIEMMKFISRSLKLLMIFVVMCFSRALKVD